MEAGLGVAIVKHLTSFSIKAIEAGTIEVSGWKALVLALTSVHAGRRGTWCIWVMSNVHARYTSYIQIDRLAIDSNSLNRSNKTSQCANIWS
jgi:hypothetical protein